MSNRILTDEQFSNYTTVDGNRLDKALQDTEDLVNNTDDGLLGTRWMQSQIVMGWTPLATLKIFTGGGITSAAYRCQHPWLRFYNSDADKIGTGTIAHPFRVKGTGTTSHDWILNTTNPWVPADTDKTIWVWTTKLYVTDPVIIDSIDLNMHYLDGAPNTFPGNLFMNPAGTDHVTGNIQVTISIDDPGATEQPIAQALELQIRDIDTATARFNSVTALPSAGHLGMQPSCDNPSVPGTLITLPNGNELWIQASNINKHIPANSRVIFTIALNADKAVAAGETLDPQSYQRSMPNMVVTFLEGLK
tara:strand:- start:267 stop:1181 length:915 start_codon:yes stop_codon:yes gene_type:complete